MSMPSRHERLAELFASLRGAAPEERRRRLAEACPDDPTIAEEAESLLDAAAEPDALLDEGPGNTLREQAARTLEGRDEPEQLPERIGSFRIVGVLGEGGMGRVYEAEQDRPRRRVALKLLRTSAMSAAARRRFELEAEIVARLQHPGIAQLLEAGIADVPGFGPQPYIAMELVRGTSITEHVRSHGLGPREVALLVAQACDAVQHAHERGVVHRDLKPANVLAGEDGRPRIVDFGIARVVDPALREGTALTASGHILGTLAYMSPEQVRGRSALVDARSDVYSLGAITWELLAGRPPHDVHDASLPEAARRIAEDDAPRLSSIEASLRGDLEVILAKALEKDPGRRYASAAELAADLRRFAADEPIFARAPSAGYHLIKFARRHRALAAAVLLAVAALLAGTAAALWQAERARDRAADAERARDEAERTRDQAEHLAYRASLAAAVSAIEAQDFAGARSILRQAPSRLRGWEWSVLEAGLSRSAFELARIEGVMPWLILPKGDVVLVRGNAGGVDTLVRIDARTGSEIPPRFAIGGHRPLVLPGQILSEAWRYVAFEAGEAEVPIFDESGAERTRVRRCRADATAAIAGLLPGGEPILQEYTDPPAVLACSPDGRRLLWSRAGGDVALTILPGGVLAAGDRSTGSIQLWDGHAGRMIRQGPATGSDFAHIAATPDGRTLVAGASNDGNVHLIRADTLEILASRSTPRAGWVPAILADAGRLVVTPGPSGSVVSRSVDTLDPIVTLPGHEIAVGPVADWPEAGLVLSGDASGRILAWNVADLRVDARVLGGHGTYVYLGGWSRDGSRLVVQSFDDRIHVWDVARATRTAMSEELVSKQVHIPGTLVTEPAGTHLIGYHDELLTRLDPLTGAVLARCGDCGGSRMALSPDGSLLVAWGGRDGLPGEVTRLVDPAEMKVIRRVPHVAGAFAFSPDGRLLVARSGTPTTGDVAILEVPDMTVRARVPIPDGRLTGVAWSPDGTRVVAVSENGTGLVLDRDGGVVARLRRPDRLLAATFTPDGSRLILAGDGGQLRVHDTENWTELVAIPGHSFYVYSMAWSPDGSTLASFSGDGSVRLWRSRVGESGRAFR